VLIVANQARLEAALEQMARAAVAGVEAGGVQPVQPLHPFRQRRLPALDDQVEVIAHQAVGVQLPVMTIGDAEQEVDEEPPVLVVHEDQAPVDAARRQVVDAVGEGQPPWPWHALKPRRGRHRKWLLWTDCHALVALDMAVPATSRASPWTRPRGTGAGRCGHVRGLALDVSPAGVAVGEVLAQDERR
jgi:hypothetical protein